MKNLDFNADKVLVKEFLSNFTDINGEPKYMNILQEVANYKIRAIQIDLEDLDNYKDKDEEFFRRITENTRRYVGIFPSAVDELLPAPTEDIPDDVPILMTQRAEDGTENADGTNPLRKMPPEIKLNFKAISKGRAFTIREVKASYIGKLVRISGIVTCCSDVKPLMQVAVYTCEECGFEIYQEVTARVFMPLFECPTDRCKVNKTKGNLILQLRASKFLKFQEAKIQELPEHVPKGHIPRSMTVHLRGELTRKVAPGDIPTWKQCLSLIFRRNMKIMNLGKMRKSKFLVQLRMSLLLLLVGAPHRKLKDGMKIRGDLHICLMDDPEVAKSQLLKHIINVAPRGVYTTGKGSSGVGLTAAVQKDPVTNEMVLEGGALELADMGICAIDEFDKMDESDRTAIHEVMEQQTVSIAKAGITTSLNARTAILALPIQPGEDMTYVELQLKILISLQPFY
ncbi:hypothetical protein SLE2022_242340 [Rubroshorea leprosula]